jgi:hypothetical protein
MCVSRPDDASTAFWLPAAALAQASLLATLTDRILAAPVMVAGSLGATGSSGFSTMVAAAAAAQVVRRAPAASADKAEHQVPRTPVMRAETAASALVAPAWLCSLLEAQPPKKWIARSTHSDQGPSSSS